MKKTAMRVSGNITLIFFFLLFLISAISLCTALEVKAVVDVVSSSQIFQIITAPIMLIFITIPAYLLGLTGLNLPQETSLIIAIAFAVFSFLMFLWGIKEVKLANRDNERFAKCKKTCAFMMFTKFMFFAYLIAVVVLSVMNDTLAVMAIVISELLNVPNIFLIITAVLALVAFIIFVLPVSNISVVYNAVKYGEDYDEPAAQTQNAAQDADSQELQSFYTQAPQPTMQANMPPMPGYKPQVVVQTTAQPMQQNVQPQVASMPQANGVAPQPTVQPMQQPQVAAQPVVQPNMVNPQPVATQPAAYVQPQPAVQPGVQPSAAAQAPAGQGGLVPGQDGIPANITEKGLADLQRLERLKSMGAITPENYAAMKQKICSTNIE